MRWPHRGSALFLVILGFFGKKWAKWSKNGPKQDAEGPASASTIAQNILVAQCLSWPAYWALRLSFTEVLGTVFSEFKPFVVCVWPLSARTASFRPPTGTGQGVGGPNLVCWMVLCRHREYIADGGWWPQRGFALLFVVVGHP